MSIPATIHTIPVSSTRETATATVNNEVGAFFAHQLMNQILEKIEKKMESDPTKTPDPADAF